MNPTSIAIIDSITCPITADVMVDPVQGTDGQTYERAAIIQALNIKNESPITRQPMTITDLRINASIRFLNPARTVESVVWLINRWAGLKDAAADCATYVILFPQYLRFFASLNLVRSTPLKSI